MDQIKMDWLDLVVDLRLKAARLLAFAQEEKRDKDAARLFKLERSFAKAGEQLLKTAFGSWEVQAREMLPKLTGIQASVQTVLEQLRKDNQTAKNVIQGIGQLDEAFKIIQRIFPTVVF